jgi:hypothetical protein
MERSRVLRIAVAVFLFLELAAPWTARAHDEPSLQELKGRLGSVEIRDRPALCIRISELELDAADKLYNAGESMQAQAALANVVSFAEMARDYALQSHKHEKQSEIALRRAAHKLADLKHAISREDQNAVQSAIDRLQHVRDDLLFAMFPRAGAK